MADISFPKYLPKSLNNLYVEAVKLGFDPNVKRTSDGLSFSQLNYENKRSSLKRFIKNKSKPQKSGDVPVAEQASSSARPSSMKAVVSLSSPTDEWVWLKLSTKPIALPFNEKEHLVRFPVLPDVLVSNVVMSVDSDIDNFSFKSGGSGVVTVTPVLLPRDKFKASEVLALFHESSMNALKLFSNESACSYELDFEEAVSSSDLRRKVAFTVICCDASVTVPWLFYTLWIRCLPLGDPFALNVKRYQSTFSLLEFGDEDLLGPAGHEDQPEQTVG